MSTPDYPANQGHHPPPWEMVPPLTAQQERRLQRRIRRRQLPILGSLLAARDYRRSVKTVYSHGGALDDDHHQDEHGTARSVGERAFAEQLNRSLGLSAVTDPSERDEIIHQFSAGHATHRIDPDAKKSELDQAFPGFDQESRLSAHAHFEPGTGRFLDGEDSVFVPWHRVRFQWPDGHYTRDVVQGRGVDDALENAQRDMPRSPSGDAPIGITYLGLDDQSAPGPIDGPEFVVNAWLRARADELLAAQRAGDTDRAQEIRDMLRPDHLDRLLGGYPGVWSGREPEPGQPWTWTEHVNHLGNSGAYADPAAAATRDYITAARADRDAERPSPADPDHPGHDHYLRRSRHYQELQEAQDHRDAERASVFLFEIRSWADRHELDVDAEAGIIDGAIELAAGSAAERDAVRHAMIDLRKQHAPDHLAFAAAVGDDRFSAEADEARLTQRLDTLRQAIRDDDTIAVRAMRSSIEDTLDHARQHDKTIDPGHHDVVEAKADAPSAQDIEGADVGRTRADRQLVDPDPAPVYVTGSRGRESGASYVVAQDETLDSGGTQGVDLSADTATDTPDRARAAGQRLQLDRDEPRTGRGRSEPDPVPAPTATAPTPVHEHVAAANRGVDDHDEAGQVSPDVQRLRAAVDQHVAHRDRETPAADKSPPQPSSIGREL